MEFWPETIPARLCNCLTTVTDSRPNKPARDDESKDNLCILCQPPKPVIHLETDVKRKLQEVMKDVKETQKRINMLTIDAASASKNQNRGCVSEYITFLRKLYGPTAF